jgi:hypothetical protein
MMPLSKRRSESEHAYKARFPLSLWTALVESAHADGRSLNERLLGIVRQHLSRLAFAAPKAKNRGTK